jgi:hypothetical protein
MLDLRPYSIFRRIALLLLLLLLNLCSGVLIDKCEVLSTFGIVSRGPQFFKKTRSHLEILDARKVAWRKFHSEDPKFWSDL